MVELDNSRLSVERSCPVYKGPSNIKYGYVNCNRKFNIFAVCVSRTVGSIRAYGSFVACENVSMY